MTSLDKVAFFVYGPFVCFGCFFGSFSFVWFLCVCFCKVIVSWGLRQPRQRLQGTVKSFAGESGTLSSPGDPLAACPLCALGQSRGRSWFWPYGQATLRGLEWFGDLEPWPQRVNGKPPRQFRFPRESPPFRKLRWPPDPGWL